MKANPKTFKWFEYKGRTVEIAVGDLVLTLSKGEVYGLKKTKYWNYTDSESLEHTLRLDDFDANRLVQNSKGWAGKVGRTSVDAGAGGLDVKKVVVQSDPLINIQADSSNLQKIVYNPAKKILYIEFRNGARWAYYKVTQKEADGIRDAKSQGSFFHYMIKTQKEQKEVKEFK